MLAAVALGGVAWYAATVPLTDGAATVTLPALSRTTTVTALYTGDGGYTPTLTLGVLRVR